MVYDGSEPTILAHTWGKPQRRRCRISDSVVGIHGTGIGCDAIARTRYCEQVFDAHAITDIDFIVASIRCDYSSPVRHGETLEVGIRIPIAGRTSFDFEYRAHTTDGRPVARAVSTQVRYDYATETKKPLSEDWFARVTAAQGTRPPHR